MRNPNRIRPFMEWLTKEWEAHPDYRFGQFLINYGIIPDGMAMWQTDISDYEFEHEVAREIITWGVLCEYKCERKYVLIKDLETDHIKNIIKTQLHIRSTKIEKVLRDELKYRKKNGIK